ncbi:MAG: hypothetical protein ABS81_11215 [Pseudonocardia sp. SCN 72-86]|nr:MAG: hypothetical protein ABS81_11215 [Pseudonocardia sp. SCN 72-86]
MRACADLVGDARVVGIGENNHHIAEFGALRLELVEFLVAELGFRIVAMESGFAEGALVDDWVRGGDGGFPAADGFTFRFGDAPEVHELMARLRERGDVRYSGLDVPGSGGSPLAALNRLRLWVGGLDGVDDTPIARAIEAVAAATTGYASPNNGVAAGRYAALGDVERDAATAAAARLLMQVEARSDDPVARHLALGVVRLDEQLREFGALGSPDPPPLAVSSRDLYLAVSSRDLYLAVSSRDLYLAVSSRDLYMADSVRLLLRESDARVVLLQHNGHLQRVPLQLVPGVRVRSCGTYLAAELGEAYRAIGVTAVSGTTTTVGLDDSARHGIVVGTQELTPPDPDGIEAALAADAPVLADLRPRRGKSGPSSIRHAHITSPVDVATGYDGIVCLPTMSPAFTG